MDVGVYVSGHKEIDKVLLGLPLQPTHKLLQAAHTSAVKKTVDAAKLLAPEGPTGRLIDSIGTIKTSVAKAGSLGETLTGPRRGKYKGFAAHLVEKGTKKRSLLGKGKYKAGTDRGIMPAKPFMKPAWDRTKDDVLGSIKFFLAKHLSSYMRRTIKRSGL
jgi:hypothetical protein